MTLGALNLGDVNTTCGVSPCGLMDFFSPSADCVTWRDCAAFIDTPASPACVPGGLDANGNTIVSCGGTSPNTVDWSNPSAAVAPGAVMPSGDTYAGPVTTVAQIQSDIAAGTPVPKQSSVGTMPYVVLGVVVLGLMLIGGRR
jgi:hypothetical protein